VTAARFDDIVHAASRLQICGLAAATELIEFAVLRDILQISDSALSKHLAILEEAGYVRLRKSMSGSRIRTWVSLTRTGRQALEGHVAALQAIAAGQYIATSPRK
jgi:DNA-binding MarR family transcriptional regulator